MNVNIIEIELEVRCATMKWCLTYSDRDESFISGNDGVIIGTCNWTLHRSAQQNLQHNV